MQAPSWIATVSAVASQTRSKLPKKHACVAYNKSVNVQELGLSDDKQKLCFTPIIVIVVVTAAQSTHLLADEAVSL